MFRFANLKLVAIQHTILSGSSNVHKVASTVKLEMATFFENFRKPVPTRRPVIREIFPLSLPSHTISAKSQKRLSDELLNLPTTNLRFAYANARFLV